MSSFFVSHEKRQGVRSYHRFNEIAESTSVECTGSVCTSAQCFRCAKQIDGASTQETETDLERLVQEVDLDVDFERRAVDWEV